MFGFKNMSDGFLWDPDDGLDASSCNEAPPMPEVVVIDGTPMLAVPKNMRFVTHYEVVDTGQCWDAVFENGRCTIENEYNPSLDNAPN